MVNVAEIIKDRHYLVQLRKRNYMKYLIELDKAIKEEDQKEKENK